MIRAAMAQDGGSPRWAVGDPADLARVRSAASKVSKFLGRSAERVPDWETVAWLVEQAVPVVDRESVLAKMAGLWWQAEGREPPGHTGRIERGELVRGELVDPALAPDDATRMRIYQEKLTEALARADALEVELLEREKRIDNLGRQLGLAEDRYRGEVLKVKRLESAMSTARSRLDEVRADLESARCDTDAQQALNEQLAGEHQGLKGQITELSQHLAAVVAHVVVPMGSPWASRSGEHCLAAMPLALWGLLQANVPTRRTPRTAWLAVYLRALATDLSGPQGRIRLAGGEGLMTELNEVVAGRRVPSRRLLNALGKHFPQVHEYGFALRAAAIQEGEHLVFGQSDEMVTSVSSQITVAELLGREGGSLALADYVRKPGRHRKPVRAGMPLLEYVQNNTNPESA
ncbi:hypothetical protein BN6_68260 [Saccharothrix espanaensis DSM 44229]|uniref:Uncharacterized protein n=2 Tax=Saccharothrix espanaensis TaxID=103731 RepID=K0KBR6_SACES|nr:hypothetical protein BN6_68260 [Saccharothrix espanaensis DSM 44229]